MMEKYGTDFDLLAPTEDQIKTLIKLQAEKRPKIAFVIPNTRMAIAKKIKDLIEE